MTTTRALTGLGLLSLTALTAAAVGGAPANAAPARTAPAPAPLRILLTDDDGYTAPGIRAVFDKLTAAGHDVTIVAPAQNQSGTGTAQSTAPTLKAEHVSSKVWAVTGTPGDAVSFGLYSVFKDKAPDLVVSGTNYGQNPAAIADHSGTVGAAITALDNGVPAMAVSTETTFTGPVTPTLNAQRHTADFLVRLLAKLQGRAQGGRLLPEHTGLNINYPIVGADGERPATRWALTRLDRQPLLVPSYTDTGNGTYAVKLSYTPRRPGPASDVAALAADKISITPIDGDWTAATAAYTRTAALLKGLTP
ncbi:5'/3'-nucleotidase SurE [Actinomadura opuntiae]|uniref:5'/3'-nucleotidase SurE n=1 Tax=Actinomadura sp. OS1-43 TaxID=604315 RepID=UPI00255B1506|nr:5'/3'-nucleotidase SurE [Actinomadura sp. OS1-43]MDL4816968.1 5'/3'-nucleotidase SurE [Actinomadura sp. OS1-43]